jgi:hypothetical protein
VRSSLSGWRVNGRRRQCGFGAHLHALVYDHDVAAVAAGKERGAEGEAIDFPLHLQAPARTPSLGHIERDRNDHPLQGRIEALESGLKGSG